jgi:hypothetical protein
MKAPMARIPFRLYIAVEDGVIEVVLMQVMDGKEHIIIYLSWRLIDDEMRYLFIEKLCLSLFYACIVACQDDVIKHMLQQLILSERVRK